MESEEVSSHSVEETSAKLWNEFVRGWFSGQTHLLDSVPVLFPSVKEVKFGQMPITQGLDGFSFQFIYSQSKTTKRRQAQAEWVRTEASWQIYVRANVTAPRADGRNAVSLCRHAADMLYGVLSDGRAMLPMTRKGITLCRPRPPRHIQSHDWVMRSMEVKATLFYPMRFGVSVAVSDTDEVLGV